MDSRVQPSASPVAAERKRPVIAFSDGSTVYFPWGRFAYGREVDEHDLRRLERLAFAFRLLLVPVAASISFGLSALLTASAAWAALYLAIRHVALRKAPVSPNALRTEQWREYNAKRMGLHLGCAFGTFLFFLLTSGLYLIQARQPERVVLGFWAVGASLLLGYEWFMTMRAGERTQAWDEQALFER